MRIHLSQTFETPHRRMRDVKFNDFINGRAALMMTFRSIDSGLSTVYYDMVQKYVQLINMFAAP